MQQHNSQPAVVDSHVLHDLFNRCPIGIAVENMEGQPLFVNPALCSILGFSQEELCRKHCVDFSPREDAEKDWELFQQLRAGSIDNYQIEKRYFRRDGSLMWGSLSVSFLNNCPSPMALAMVEDIAEKKKAGENRFRLAAIVESCDEAVVSKTLDGKIETWNAGAQRLYEYTEQEAVGQPISIIVPPELTEEENKIMEKAKMGERIERYETTRLTKSGRRIDICLNLSPIKDAGGTTLGFSGIARDVTQRKLAEQALAEMTRKLLEAQEQERARIGRELHDDINQRLAMLAIELEQLQDNTSEVETRARELHRQAAEISNDIQALSHDLHSSKLRYLGVVAGTRSWCKEFGDRQRVEVSFRSNVSDPLPPEVGMCLFRVVQEALHNAVKHSGVKQIDVQLIAEADEVCLSVSDSGRGFDVESATESKGLGLTSMRDRVRLVNGIITIESRPLGGTTIHVRIPLKSVGAQRAAS